MKGRPVVLALCALLALTGCDRRPRLRGPEADSTATGRVDPVERLVSNTVRLWEEGAVAPAADSTAVWLALRLAGESGPWEARSRELLDSLAAGAECEGGEGFVVVNLFSRSELEGATYPRVFWSEGSAVRQQVIEGEGMHLLDAAVAHFGGDAPTDSARLAVLWARSSRAGRQPQVMAWSRVDDAWQLQQALGPDSLGGTGTGRFENGELVTRTWRATPRFEEIGANALRVERERRFTWDASGFTRVSDVVVPSPYATFTAFIAALIRDDREEAAARTSDRALVDFARRLRWHEVALGTWRVAPGTEAGGLEMVFFRGPREAFRVRFQRSGEDFLVSGFETTERSVE